MDKQKFFLLDVLVVEGSRVVFLGVDQNILFKRMAETPHYFFIVVFGPAKLVLKTSFEVFLNTNVLFFKKKHGYLVWEISTKMF